MSRYFCMQNYSFVCIFLQNGVAHVLSGALAV